MAAGSDRLEPAFVVETPEQIGIDFEIAGVGSRVMAAVVDGLCMTFLLLAAVILPLLLMPSSGAAVERAAENLREGRRTMEGVQAGFFVVATLASFGVTWGYYIIAELVTDGRSPGKRALGLRVVRDDGLPIGAAQSFVRNLVRFVDFLPAVYGVGLVSMVLSARGQRLGDLAAGTVVVKDRAGQKLGDVPPAPAPSAPLAARPAALTAAEREVVLRFLDRRHELDRATRARLAARIAAPLRARLGDGGVVGDESFLMAVAGDEPMPPPAGGPRVS